MPVPAAAGLPRRVDVTAQDDHLYPISRASTCCQRSLPGAWARLVGNVVTVGNDTAAPAPALTARTWAAAARCSAALLGLEAVIGDCWLSLGACMPTVSDHILQNVVGLSAQDCESLDLHKIVTSISSHTHEAFGRSRTATWLYIHQIWCGAQAQQAKNIRQPITVNVYYPHCIFSSLHS